MPRQFGPALFPIARPRYFLGCHAKRLDQPLWNEMLAVIRSDRFPALVKPLPGYDGRVLVLQVHSASSRDGCLAAASAVVSGTGEGALALAPGMLH
jgi:hypothetical protein